MRIYVPTDAGLGAREVYALRRLSRPALRLISGQFRNPSARSEVLRILRAPDPERALAARLSREIAHRFSGPVAAAADRFSIQLGEDISRIVPKYEQFRKERIVLAKQAAQTFKVAKQGAAQALKEVKKTKDKEDIVAAKTAYKDAITAAKGVLKETEKYVSAKLSKEEQKQFIGEEGKAVAGRHWSFFRDTQTGEVVATQAKTMKSGNFFSKAGKALKPFIPIITTVIGAVLAIPTGGASLAAAAVINAGYAYNQKRLQVNKAKKENRAVSKQMKDAVKAEEAALKKQLDDLFQQHPDIFAAAGITSGQWAAMTVQQKLAAVERINSGQMPSSQANVDAAVAAQGGTAPAQGQTWQQAIQSSPIMEQWGEEAGDTDIATEGVQTPTGTYDVYVEGKKVGTAQTLDDASAILAQSSKAGDRVEMTLNGKSLGLKIVTSGGGVISVPPELVARVRAASRSEVDGIIQRATSNVGASSAGSGGGIWTLLLLGGGALALAAGGHKR